MKQSKNMHNNVTEFMKQRHFAVAGSFRNESKYAYQILKKLIQKGYTVYPVNPKLSSVDNITCYPCITDIPEVVDVVNLVTPPAISEKIVRECKNKNILKVWFQPGAESVNAIKFCKENNIDVIYDLCVMVETL